MEILDIPGVQAIFSAALISWLSSLTISLLALLFVSKSNLRHFYPEIKAVVGLVSLALLTVHVVTGRWMFF